MKKVHMNLRMDRSIPLKKVLNGFPALSNDFTFINISEVFCDSCLLFLKKHEPYLRICRSTYRCRDTTHHCTVSFMSACALESTMKLPTYPYRNS